MIIEENQIYKSFAEREYVVLKVTDRNVVYKDIHTGLRSILNYIDFRYLVEPKEEE